MGLVFHELAHQGDVGGVGSFCLPVSGVFAATRSPRLRLEIERELEVRVCAANQSAERSKQRCGPGEKVFFCFDQM